MRACCCCCAAAAAADAAEGPEVAQALGAAARGFERRRSCSVRKASSGTPKSAAPKASRTVLVALALAHAPLVRSGGGGCCGCGCGGGCACGCCGRRRCGGCCC